MGLRRDDLHFQPSPRVAPAPHAGAGAGALAGRRADGAQHHDQVGWRARTKFIMLLASFLGSPARWCRIPYSARFEFWPDEADGCAWDSATPASLLEVRTSLPGDMRRRDPERLPPLEK